MKNLFISFLLIFFIGGIYTTTSAKENKKSNLISFTISGKIEGLVSGDTLCFERVVLPEWDLKPAFNIIVSELDKFAYDGSHPHIQYYLMTYKPTSGKATESDKRGINVLIEEGNTSINGNINQIYYSKVKNQIYNNPDLQKCDQLEDSLGKERSSFLQLMHEAYASGDSLKGKEYSDKFNNFRIDHENDYKRLSELYKEFSKKNPSSEIVLINLLQESSYTPVDTLMDRYGKMTPEAQNSYYGEILKQRIERLEKLVPGSMAPDFQITTTNDIKLSLKDLAGNYVLIYHWGLCPGSLMIDSDVIELYEKYKDHFKVIGVTDKMSFIQGTYNTTNPGDKFMDVELKPILENMLVHPWYDVEDIGDNHKLTEDYVFGGYPFFIFISPDGKIIARDFYPAFNKAKKTLKKEFGN